MICRKVLLFKLWYFHSNAWWSPNKIRATIHLSKTQFSLSYHITLTNLWPWHINVFPLTHPYPRLFDPRFIKRHRERPYIHELAVIHDWLASWEKQKASFPTHGEGVIMIGCLSTWDLETHNIFWSNAKISRRGTTRRRHHKGTGQTWHLNHGGILTHVIVHSENPCFFKST